MYAGDGVLLPSAFLLAAVTVWLATLLTHKLTMQLALFLSAVLAAALGSWLPFVVGLGGIPLVYLLSGGFYGKILKGHWDIVSFWHRNLDLLGAHEVHDSPLYGGGRRAAGEGTAWRRAVPLLSYNPFLLLALYLCLTENFFRDASPAMHFLALWTAGVVLWSLLTTFVPFLVALGQGYRYVKYALFPASVLIAASYKAFGAPERTALFLLLLLSAWSMGRAWKQRRGGAAASLQDNDFLALAAYLKAHPRIDRIGCLSTHLCDPLVYLARKKVLWGTHSYCFNEKVVRFFPVLRHTPAELSRIFDLRYWCVDTNYVDPAVVGLREEVPGGAFGPYRLYRAPS